MLTIKIFREHPLAKEIQIHNFVNKVWQNPFVWDTTVCLLIRRDKNFGGPRHLQCNRRREI